MLNQVKLNWYQHYFFNRVVKSWNEIVEADSFHIIFKEASNSFQHFSNSYTLKDEYYQSTV